MLLAFPFIFISLYLLAPTRGRQDLQRTYTSDVSEIPLIGFGTWNLDQSNISDTVALAIRTGYRHLDCASAYGDEGEVGEGIRKGLGQVQGLKREDLWVTSKLWNDRHRPQMVLPAVQDTLSDLGLDYLDNYLMHWPMAASPEDGGIEGVDYVQTWHAMEELVDQGLVRHIGMSNFAPGEMERLMKSARIQPYNHQMELHPFLPQQDWVDWHQSRGIKVTAYSPLANANPTYHSKNGDTPRLLELDSVKEIAHKHSATPAQIVLAWGIKRGVAVIPKSSHPTRIAENSEATKFVDRLDQEDLDKMKGISNEYPTRFSDPSEDWGYTFFEGLFK